MTLKLGPKRAHHAAHAPDDDCVLRHPESALHYNLKCRLAESLEDAMRRGHPLTVLQWCVGAPDPIEDPWETCRNPRDHSASSEIWGTLGCEETNDHVWLTTWTRVALEQRLCEVGANRVPDLVLYDGDRAVGAIEVFHTHPVDEEKAVALAALGLPWIEVKADPALLVPETAWRPEHPLPAHRVVPMDRTSWRCPEHAKAHAAWREARRRRVEFKGAKFVDLRFPHGQSERLLYLVEERQRDGQPIAARLVRLDDSGRHLCFEVEVPGAYTDALRGDLNARVTSYVEDELTRATATHAAGVDSPMTWATGSHAREIGEQAARQGTSGFQQAYPSRYSFDRTSRVWVVPPEYEHISWTRRQAERALTEHPAWRVWRASIEDEVVREARERETRLLEWRRQRHREQQERDAAALDSERRAREQIAGVPVTLPAIDLSAVRAELSRTTGKPASRLVTPDDLGIIPAAVEHGPAGSMLKLPRPHANARDAWIGMPLPGADYQAIRALDQHIARLTPYRVWLSRREEWDWALVDDVPWLEVREAFGILGVETRRFVGTLPDFAHAMAQGLHEFAPAVVLALRHADRLRGF